MIRSILCATLIVLALQASPVAGQREEATPTPAPTTSSTPASTPTPAPTSTPAHPGVVTGVVFHDRDLDGVRGEGEEGLAGWPVQAYPSIGESDATYPDGSGASSGSDGSFRIENLDVTWPAWHFVVDLWEEFPNHQYHKILLPQPLPFSFDGSLVQIDVPVAFDDDTAVTFHVWEDFDGDGTISAADQLALWTDVVIETPEGARVFETSGQLTSLTLTGLLPAIYVAHATTDPINHVVFSVDEMGSPDQPVELLSKPHATFYGFVYRDDNQNGTRDAGEPGLAGAAIEVETRYADGATGEGRDAEQDGSYVIVDEDSPAGTEVYIGCGNVPMDGYGEVPWRGSIGMTYGHHGFWFQDRPVVIAQGVYRYPVDCGLVYEMPQQGPIFVSPAVSGNGIGLPPSGSGSGGGSGTGWLAPALAGIGALLIAWAMRSKSKRPGPYGARPRYR